MKSFFHRKRIVLKNHEEKNEENLADTCEKKKIEKLSLN